MGASPFMEQVRTAMRLRQLSYRTEQSYCDAIRRFIVFHGKRHPRELGPAEVVAYLTHLVCDKHLSASSQHVALSALQFLYRVVLEQPLPPDLIFPRATKSPRLPVVFTRREVQVIFARLDQPYLLMAQLLYGAGLRLMECLRLRVKDIDVERQQITVRQGKGDKDRVTMLPAVVISALHRQLAASQRIHNRDLAEGFGAVELPDALARKYPSAARSWGWQYVFPAEHRSRDPRLGVTRRHHMLEDNLQRAVRRAIQQAGITKHGSCHTFRHSFATHLIEDGYDLRTVQELLGHQDVGSGSLSGDVLGLVRDGSTCGVKDRWHDCSYVHPLRE